MSDRTDFFYRQLVSEAALDEALADLETAVMRVLGDIGLRGVFSGLTVAETSPTGLEVAVTAGTARDQAGNRIRVPSTQTVDISEDYLGVPTTVATTGNQKYLSVYVTFDRSLESPQTDGNGDTVYTRRLESFGWKVVQGTESATPSRPALLSDAILLADVLISYGTTAVVNADLSTTRRMDAISIAGTPIALTTGNIVTALTSILTVVNAHIAGTGQYHPASVIQYNGSGAFANGSTTLSAAGLEAVIDQFVTLLSGTSSDPAGEDLIGVRSDATQSPTLPGGTLRARHVALRMAENLVYGGSGNFADGNPIAAGTIEASIDALVTALAGSTGLAKISGATITQSPTSISGASAQSMLAALLTAVNARALAAFTPTGGIAATTVHTALAELDTDKAAVAGANTFTAKQTFDLASAGVGLETASDTRADFNGEVEVPRINVGVQNAGVIAADVQITNDVGSVFVQAPGTDTVNYCLAMPVPANGNPVLHLKFYGGGTGSSRRVWITTTADIGAPPSNYFAYWEANSNARAGAVFAWDGTRWRHIVSTGLTGTAGGGTLAE